MRDQLVLTKFSDQHEHRLRHDLCRTHLLREPSTDATPKSYLSLTLIQGISQCLITVRLGLASAMDNATLNAGAQSSIVVDVHQASIVDAILKDAMGEKITTLKADGESTQSSVFGVDVV